MSKSENVVSLSEYAAQRAPANADHKQLVMDIVTEMEARASQRKESHPFATLARRWERTHLPDLAKSSAVDARTTVNKLVSRFGDLTSQKLDRDAVDEYFRKMEGDGLSVRTINKTRGVGLQIIKMASTDHEWLEPNPFLQSKRRRPVPASHKAFLTAGDAIRLLSVLSGQKRRLFASAIYTGARKSELLSWKREDVDLIHGMVRIRRSRGNEYTKNRTHRQFPINAELGPYLIEQLESHQGEFVFQDEAGNRFRDDWDLASITRSALSRAGVVEGFRFTCRKCGTKEKNLSDTPKHCPACKRKLWCAPIPKQVSFHSLRHCTASFYKAAGCDHLVRKIMLGHTVQDITDGVYTDLSEGFMRANINKMSLTKLAKLESKATPKLFGSTPVGMNPTGRGTQPFRPRRTTNPKAVGSNPSGRMVLFTTPGLRTLSEVCEVLKVSRETVYSAIKSGKLRAYRIGSVYRIHSDDVEAFLR